MSITEKIYNRMTLFQRKLLKRIYFFDEWHVSTLESKEYARNIIEIVNGLNEGEKVVEIGCGLGDIIRNIAYKEKIGLDIDNRVLSASRLLSIFLDKRSKTKFEEFDFICDSLEGAFNVIIMVNWIHNIEPKLLSMKMQDIIDNHLPQNGVLILDVVDNNNYRYNHKIDLLLNGRNLEIKEFGPFNYGRHIVLLKKL